MESVLPISWCPFFIRLGLGNPRLLARNLAWRPWLRQAQFVWAIVRPSPLSSGPLTFSPNDQPDRGASRPRRSRGRQCDGEPIAGEHHERDQPPITFSLFPPTPINSAGYHNGIAAAFGGLGQWRGRRQERARRATCPAAPTTSYETNSQRSRPKRPRSGALRREHTAVFSLAPLAATEEAVTGPIRQGRCAPLELTLGAHLQRAPATARRSTS
jgi:hypothetical protein